ncbi:hypothetical protein [Vibrio nitrifigilis]|uniref:Uncharacterized protein n=1 Tax=Vibrio nitrifigilis TaxID=2789781 RepID=A0ABS0GDE3_9VIBR|nr:hypothetical protein [Vibrio nitrifigilis]MBF9000438.1 hypothetical protein [Vibrio nitrifigilis]
MKFVYPITKSDGSEFPNQDELETVISQETIGQYGFNPSHNTFHGGIHFTKVNAPWVRKYYPIRAIADGNIIACRLSEDYPETEYGHQKLPFSHNFCLIEHEFDYKDDDDNDATFNFYSLYMHLATINDDKSDVEEEPIQHVLAQSWFARAMPKISNELNTYVKLKKGTVLLLDEDSQPRTFESNGITYNFKKYEIKDNKGLRDSLAGVGNNVWLADDPSPKESDPQFIITGGPVENAPEPIWFYQKLTGEITCNTSIRVRSDPKTNGDAGDVIGQAYNGCTISFSRTSDTKFCRIGGKKYLMARCDFTNNKAFQGNQQTVKLTSGWIAITDAYVKVNEKSDILDFNDENTPVTSTNIPVKAGEPIGYLGRFDVLIYDQERGYVADKRYQLHHELISLDKPPKAFLTAFFGDEKAANLQFASDENSHGYLLKKDPSDFFRDLALCAKKSVTNAEKCDAVTVEDDELKSVLLPQDASKLTVVQHTSEWYHKSDTSLLFQELTYLFGDNKRLKHEKDRADQLAWMQDTALFKDNAVVWNWWPISSNILYKYTCRDNNIVVKATRYNSVMGPVIWGNHSLDSVNEIWDKLIDNSTITQNESIIIKSMAKNEGKLDSVQSYDSELLTAGAMQKTIKVEGNGELLEQLIKFSENNKKEYIEYFYDYGWIIKNDNLFFQHQDIADGRLLSGNELKTIIRSSCIGKNVGDVIDCIPIKNLGYSIQQDAYVKLQILDFVKRLRFVLNSQITIKNNSHTIGSIFTDNLSRAVILDQSVNRPGYVKRDLELAINTYIKNSNISSIIDSLDDDNRGDVIEGILRIYKSNRRMTDSIKRFENIEEILNA